MICMRDRFYGEILAQLRVAAGLTQKELADKMEIGHTLVSDYERGRLRLHDEIIVKFAKALNTSADTILGLANYQPKKNLDVSLRIMKRVKQIEHLPDYKQKSILKTLDDLIRANS